MRDLVEEIRVFTRSLRGLTMQDFVGWLSCRESIASLTPRDVYYICLGRLPEQASLATARYPTAQACAASIVECILSREFRERLPELLVTAYPNLDRHFFIHIPRTGGTTLRRLTEHHHGLLSWNEAYQQDDWFAYIQQESGADGQFFMLRFLAQFGGPAPETFFYTGHVALGQLLARNLIRPGDRSVAVLRDPTAIILSTVNYILTIAGGAERTPDAVEWTTWLQSLDSDWQPGLAASATFIGKLVGSKRFQADYGDMMTRFLSINGTVEGAIDAIQIARCTILDVSQIEDYARNVLLIDTPVKRENASQDFVGETLAMTNKLHAKIRSMNRRDVELISRLLKSHLLSSTHEDGLRYGRPKEGVSAA